MTAFAVAPRPPYSGTKPERDAKYRALVRTQPCAACGSWRGIESAHTGPHGMCQKASDFDCIPLCSKHHKIGKDSLHKLGPVKFARVHGLDVQVIILDLREMFGVRRQA
jgi:hypothetical protein